MLSHILEVVYQNLLLLPTYILLPVISTGNITYNNLSRSISVNKIMNAALVLLKYIQAYILSK